MVQSAELSRRDVIRVALGALACPVLEACAERSTAPVTDVNTESAATISAGRVTIDIQRVPALRDVSATPRAVLFFAAQLIVIRSGASDFIALSNVCPHAGCGVTVVRPTRLECPCHGSAFDFTGQRLEGPATRGLTPLVATLDRATQQLVVERS